MKVRLEAEVFLSWDEKKVGVEPNRYLEMRPKAIKQYTPLSDPTLSPVKTILRQVAKSSKEIIKIVRKLDNERKRKSTRRKRLIFDAEPRKVTNPSLASLTTENDEEIQKELPLYCTYEELISNLSYGDLIEPMEAESLRMMSDSL
ncbi:hypothetical protein J437_LFUL012109 [Ladona fulva]|uniref:Uncharacterized protein n=1 Tax=Ladona fulva TaxID=123851 RepID=A0A8K0KDS0_LADFU|nr:hypothetical protein J437_LFUL012109 [Ladona fulva]